MTLAFYVLTKSGVLLYSQQVTLTNYILNQPNPLLIAGFFSAIEMFAKEFANDSIDSIEMGAYSLHFSSDKETKCIFCLGYPKKYEESKFKYLLNTLKLFFIYYFKKYLLKNTSNLSPFKKFDPVFNLILEAFEINSEIIKIEHFICGYLGDLRDFQSKKGFICPKCRKRLSEDGVDYRLKLDKEV